MPPYLQGLGLHGDSVVVGTVGALVVVVPAPNVYDECIYMYILYMYS